jgi:hypothetical protein
MTTRQYKLMGDPINVPATGTVTINGVEVFNGEFGGGPLTPEVPIFTGSSDIVNPADGSNIVLPVTVTVTGGWVQIGMFEWNYASIINPAYTPEQLAIVQNPDSTPEQRFAVYEAVANPPFSSADLAIFASTDPADDPIKYALLYEHQCLPYIQDPESFAYGLSPELCYCNRTDVLLDGVTPPDVTTNVPINVQAGQVLTFNTIVFASNVSAQPPTGYTL